MEELKKLKESIDTKRKELELKKSSTCSIEELQQTEAELKALENEVALKEKELEILKNPKKEG